MDPDRNKQGRAPIGTPGYTGLYEVRRDGWLYAMQPDGLRARVRRYDDFKSKVAR